MDNLVTCKNIRKSYGKNPVIKLSGFKPRTLSPIFLNEPTSIHL